MAFISGNLNFNVQQKAINSVSKDYAPYETEGVVCKADPENNCCDIYLIQDKPWRLQKNVPIRLCDNGSQWFPVACSLNENSTEDDFKRSLNSLVNVQCSNSGYIIIGPSPRVPYYRFRGAQDIGQYNTSDSLGSDPGAVCTP